MPIREEDMAENEATKDDPSNEVKTETLSYHDLEKMTVGKLREIAQEYEDLVGVTGMSKEQLVETLARKKNIEIPHKVATGIDKGSIKSEIRGLKKERDAALEAHDATALQRSRRKLHRLRRQLRRASHIVG